jgi:hypothetical protein
MLLRQALVRALQKRALRLAQQLAANLAELGGKLLLRSVSARNCASKPCSRALRFRLQRGKGACGPRPDPRAAGKAPRALPRRGVVPRRYPAGPRCAVPRRARAHPPPRAPARLSSVTGRAPKNQPNARPQRKPK